VQEVIVQNFRAKPDTAMRSVPDVDLEEYLAAIAVARIVLGPKMRVQAPPNLVDLDECEALLSAGVDDFGGVSPLTPDHVNPERPWPSLDRLRSVTASSGFDLQPRLTVHPEYVRAGEPWLDPRVRGHVLALATESGLARPGVRPTGLPWQEPDGGFAASGRTDLHATIDTTGRSDDRRGDFADVYGDWDLVRADAARAQADDAAGGGVDGPGPLGATKERRGWLPPPAVALGAQVRAALTQAETDPKRLTDEQALTLMTADGKALDEVRRIADTLRRETVGDDVTYVVNRNINFTNICYTGCRFCAFAQRRTDADAFSLSLDQVADRAEEAWNLGASEVCMQGGIDPELPGTAYFDLVTAVKRRVPQMHVHAFSPMEVVNGASRTGLSIEDWLLKAKEAGLDTIPGTAAEILDDDVRWILTKGKLPTSQWIEVVTTAHRLGIRSSATMMYGHVDRPQHWVGHLRVIQRLQDESGGFTEFVPLPFVHTSAPIYLAGVARPGPTTRDNLAVHAVARIMLHGRIDHIQTSWVKLGVEGTRLMLESGCDDLGGTLMEETISRMAGSEHGSAKTVAEITEIAAGIGRPVRERITTYDTVTPRRTPTML
jgi:FO synthase